MLPEPDYSFANIVQVEMSVVKRDTSQLSRRDKLELVLSDAPELPALLSEVRTHMEALTNIVQPLVSNVTADLGASDDGLEYLRTRQQLLLAYCMNVCFYMMLKASLRSALACVCSRFDWKFVSLYRSFFFRVFSSSSGSFRLRRARYHICTSPEL